MTLKHPGEAKTTETILYKAGPTLSESAAGPLPQS